MLSGWAMMRLRMGAAGLLDVAGLGLESAGVIGSDDPVDSVRLVVSKSTMDFLHPVTKDFEVECRFDDEVLWQRFVDRFTANRWAKIRLHSVALVEHRIMARLKATYVAVRGGGPADELREELGN